MQREHARSADYAAIPTAVLPLVWCKNGLFRDTVKKERGLAMQIPFSLCTISELSETRLKEIQADYNERNGTSETIEGIKEIYKNTYFIKKEAQP